MVRLAVANLAQNRTRLVLSIAGLGLALTLVLFFAAIVEGGMSRLTVYIDHSGADLWVSQSGVKTMHMSTSSIPASVTDQVAAIPGVEQAVPVLYAEDMIGVRGKQYVGYVFGVPAGAPMGAPWGIVEGTAQLGPGEAIIDHAIAAAGGVGVGDTVTILGKPRRIAGLMSGATGIAMSVSFIPMDEFAAARGGGDVISFVLAKVKPGTSVAAVAAQAQANIPGVTVQTRQEFASQERKLIKSMTADIFTILNMMGYLTGLAVVVLTVYMATIARRREYGVLKAIGIRNRRLYEVVVLQALMSVALGLVAAVVITLVLGKIIPLVNERMVLTVSPIVVFRVAAIAVGLAGIAALVPAWQVGSLEPVTAMRKG